MIDHKYRLILENEDLKIILSQIPNLSEVRFVDEDEREWFYESLSEVPFALYECNSDPSGIYFGIRVFKSIVEFDENFGCRWFAFEEMFRLPHPEISGYLDEFRRHIYNQFKATGCDCAYYFPDQSFGDCIYDELNKNSDGWVEYLKSRQYLKDEVEPGYIFFNIQDYIKGNVILKEHENVICFIDDFSDFKDKVQQY